ncbi:MAG: hypothetical protein HOE90_21025 [Bacteriovoracaceae bacterium]|jgi:hypothetical protein|nr:hypothetical protein [Bacteriovoracaceae bacterium]
METIHAHDLKSITRAESTLIYSSQNRRHGSLIDEKFQTRFALYTSLNFILGASTLIFCLSFLEAGAFVSVFLSGIIYFSASWILGMKIIGPIKKVEMTLKLLSAGEKTKPLKFRDGDYFDNLDQTLNVHMRYIDKLKYGEEEVERPNLQLIDGEKKAS